MNEGVGNQSIVTGTLLVPSGLTDIARYNWFFVLTSQRAGIDRLMFATDFTNRMGVIAIQRGFHKAHTTRRSLAYATWYIASNVHESLEN